MERVELVSARSGLIAAQTPDEMMSR
jgi:hypothetical protein